VHPPAGELLGRLQRALLVATRLDERVFLLGADCLDVGAG
jgi:hypothetical protein